MPALEHNIISKAKSSQYLLAFCGLWLIGLGLYFIFIRAALLPEDARFLGTTTAQIQTAVPGIENWLNKVFTVMGGFMTGTGVITVFLAFMVMPLRLKGTTFSIALTGLFTVILMSGTNFAINSDFKILLVLPPIIWIVSLFLHLKAR